MAILASALAAVTLVMTASPAANAVPRSLSTRTLTVPTYTGTHDAAGGCGAAIYTSIGYEPNTSGTKYPLFINLVGSQWTPGTGQDFPVNATIAEEMAAHGFVSISAGYDNGGALFADAAGRAAQMTCIFSFGQTDSFINKACALTYVDCTKGITIFGHSQGGLLAVKASDYIDSGVADPALRKVKGVFATGISGVGSFTLPKDRLRVWAGSGEVGDNKSPASLNTITGLSCPTSSTGCISGNGSGWFIVPANITGINPDHCWFVDGGCSANTHTGAAGFLVSTDNPFAFWTLSNIASFLDNQVG
jgi:hypothetical protein